MASRQAAAAWAGWLAFLDERRRRCALLFRAARRWELTLCSVALRHWKEVVRLPHRHSPRRILTLPLTQLLRAHALT